MIKYDKFELYMVNALYDWSQKFDKDDNFMEVNIFSELMEALYQYEKLKDSGDIVTD